MTDFLSAAQLTRRSYNRTVALVGGKLVAAQLGTGRFVTSGWLTWSKFFSKQRFILEPSNVYGVSTELSTDLLARLDAILVATDAGTIVVHGFTDDITGGVSLATMISNMAAIEAKILAAGRVCVFITEPPRGASNQTGARYTSTQLEQAFTFRREMLKRRFNAGVYVIDTWYSLAERVANLGDTRFNYTSDGIRFNARGGYWFGKMMSTFFNTLFDPILPLGAANGDLWTATNPYGSVVKNPFMTGSNNAGGGGSNTGNVADNYGGTAASNGAVMTYSKVDNATTFNGSGYGDVADKSWQQIVFSGTITAATDFEVLIQTLDSTFLSVGDLLEAYAEIEIDSLVNIAGIGLHIWDNTAGSTKCADMDGRGGTVPIPTVLDTGIMKTPPTISGIVQTGNNVVRLLATPAATGAISGTLRVRGLSAFKRAP